MKTVQKGKIGEGVAREFLISRGYEILAQNYYCRYGELDLVARDTQTHTLVFVEVKSRFQNRFGHPALALTRSKKQKLLKSALHFLNSSSRNFPAIWRIDLLSLKFKPNLTLKEITHYKNILNE